MVGACLYDQSKVNLSPLNAIILLPTCYVLHCFPCVFAFDATVFLYCKRFPWLWHRPISGTTATYRSTPLGAASTMPLALLGAGNRRVFGSASPPDLVVHGGNPPSVQLGLLKLGSLVVLVLLVVECVLIFYSRDKLCATRSAAIFRFLRFQTVPNYFLLLI